MIDGFNPREFEIQGNAQLGVGAPRRRDGRRLHAPGQQHPGAAATIASRPGDTLGAAGTPGYVKHPLLHFSVIRIDASGSPQTVDIRFDDGSAAGLLPVEGRSYPGG